MVPDGGAPGPPRPAPPRRSAAIPGPSEPREAAELAQRLGIQLADVSLLHEALVHGSFPNENPGTPAIANERLEFLGDAVVNLVISEALAERHPDDDEGHLTARRAAIVSARGLARIAQRIELGSYLRMGQGAERAGARRRVSVLSASLEAVIGAIYLSAGLDVARTVMLGVAASEIATEQPATSLKAPKSELQERSYALYAHAPEYRLVSADGPDHDKHFVVDAVVEGRVLGRGEGANRRDAETEAAVGALVAMDAGAAPRRSVRARARATG